tara:strand:- start:231 stop:1250 length:1020 start_codon:yes stop_codon:yes gene_type:complete
MAYIGKQPVVGNFQKCDAISVVNGQAAYTLNVGGVAVSPESANHMIVSLNGVLQAPGDSFTVSGSTLTFASNLATGDVIDFVTLLGDVLNIGTPSDGTVGTSSIAADAVTEAKIADDAVESEHLNDNIISGQTELAETPADTDELLISDAGTLKRIDFSHLKSGGLNLISTTTISSATSSVSITGMDSTYKRYIIHFHSIHPGSDDVYLKGNVISGGSTYTSSKYYSLNRHSRTGNASIEHNNSQLDSFFKLFNPDQGMGSEDYKSLNATLEIFDPSNTTFQKFIKMDSVYDHNISNDMSSINYMHGHIDDLTAAVTGFVFEFSSGNIDSGTIKLFGVA